jgi:hypothetical protein
MKHRSNESHKYPEGIEIVYKRVEPTQDSDFALRSEGPFVNSTDRKVRVLSQ